MRHLTLATAAASLILLSGCATIPGTFAGAAYNECAELDCDKMARESRIARENGAILIWINPPKKLSDAGG